MATSPVGLRPQTNSPWERISNYVFNKIKASLQVYVTNDRVKINIDDSLVNGKNLCTAETYPNYGRKRFLVLNEPVKFTFPNPVHLIYAYRNISDVGIVYIDIDKGVDENNSIPMFVGGNKVFIKQNTKYIEFVSASDAGDSGIDNPPTYLWLEWYW